MYADRVSGHPTSRMRALFLLEAALVFGIGAAAHFFFDAIGRWPPLGWVAPVNESLWEHIKMAYWPALFAGTVLNATLPTLRHRVVCTAVSACVSALLIAPLYYGYTDILGHHHLAWDIAIFAVAVGAAQWLAYRIALGPAPTTGSVMAATGLALALGIALVAFTYAPPPMEVFRDSLTGQYGLHEGS